MWNNPCTVQESAAAHSAFSLFLKPRMARLLRTFRLDVMFHRAEGNSLFYFRHGRETGVLDLVGGFGACLLGHNHPEVCDALRQALQQQRPMLAQASVRGPAALLAERLSCLVGKSTGRSYVTTLCNGGAEAIESALKHAALTHHRRQAARLAQITEDACRYRIGVANGHLQLDADFLEQAGQLFGVGFGHPAEVLAAIETAAQTCAREPPLFLAVEGGFHGKSTGAVQLTHRREFREPWDHLGIATAFIAFDSPESLASELDAARRTVTRLDMRADGRVGLRREIRSRVAGLFCEPIQGEGGIHELPENVWHAYRTAADAEGFPLIVDEIQCGLGRCGTFLATDRFGVRGDYYVLSKALGGGVAKIGALMVDADHSEAEFDVLHTSTFADDDLSCIVALRTLEIIERDNVAHRCAERGSMLRAELERLKAAFPDQISDVRGRGLMLGVEFTRQSRSSSPLLRVLSDQGLLAYLASGYLFNHHGLRVAPTLSARSVLRIEPSAYITDAEIARLIAGLTALVGDLRAGAIDNLTRFAVSDDAPPGPAPVQRSTPPQASGAAPASSTISIGFVVHFTRAADLRAWEPGLEHFTDSECSALLDATFGLLEPFVLQQSRLRSATGEDALVTIIGAPFTPEQAIANLRSGCQGCGDLVVKAVEKARTLGCVVVGLGGYTSIVTDSGQDIVEDRVVLTTGNSLTVAAAHAALMRAAERKGLELANCRLGVVGATGNVGATLAQLAADHVGSISLIGRSGGRRHLEIGAARLLAAQVERSRIEGPSPLLAKALALSPSVREAVRQPEPMTRDAMLSLWRAFADEAGEDSPLRVFEGLDALQHCNLVVSATNAPKAIIEPHHVAAGPTVVCDIAMPQDVDPRVVRERPHAEVLRGGMVRAPYGQQIGFAPLNLAEGTMYGCLAETIVLGLARCPTHFSHGPLTVDGVRRIAALAEQHGFVLAP